MPRFSARSLYSVKEYEECLAIIGEDAKSAIENSPSMGISPEALEGHAAGCEALCARLLGLVRVSSGGVARGGRVGRVRRMGLCTKMHAVKYGVTLFDPSPCPGLQTA